MTTVNTLTLIGYVGANPEVRYMTDGGGNYHGIHCHQ